MEVILLKDLKRLGKAGDIVLVAPGYANHYLFPKGLAALATKSGKKQIVETLNQAAKKNEKLREEAVALSEKLQDLALEVKVKASEVGKIFGSVTPTDIKDAFTAHQLEIASKQIKLLAPIKETGMHEIEITLHPEVVVMVECNIVNA